MNQWTRLAFALSIVSLVGACNRGQDAAPTGPLPGARSGPFALQAPKPVVVGAFWLSGVNLGCVLPTGDFKVFRFNGNTVMVSDRFKKIPASISVIPGEDGFVVRTVEKVNHEFSLRLQDMGDESQLIRFRHGRDRKEFKCFILGEDGYIPHDGSIPETVAMVGRWNCNGTVGIITLDAASRFLRGDVKGAVVFSSISHKASQMTMSMLVGVQPDGWVAAVQDMTLNASQAAAGRVFIEGQECRKG